MSEPNDKLLDEYLKGESAVSQRYRELESQDVPSHLDSAVLAQARAAIEQGKRAKRAWVKWSAPLALAASAVLIVAIVLEVGVQEEVRMPAPQVEQATSARDQREPQAHSMEWAAQPPAVAPQPSPAIEERVAAEAKQAHVRAQAAEEARERAATARAREAASASEAADSIVVTGSHRGVQPQDSPVVATAPDERKAEAIIADSEGHEADEDTSGAAPERALAQHRGEIAPAPAASVAVTGNKQSDAISAEPLRTSAQVSAAPRLAPEQWLERIRTLRREGKVLEADEQWREFVRTYPQLEVAKDDLARPRR